MRDDPGHPDAALTFRLEPLPDRQELARAWRDLEARSAPSFFLSWFWIGSWLFESGSTPWLVRGQAGGQTVLLALLTTFRRRELGILPVSGGRLHETGILAEDSITIEYNGFLVAREWRGRAEADAIRFLLSGCHAAPIRELHIRGAEAALAPVAGRCGVLSMPSRSSSWRVELGAMRASGTRYLDQLSANTRQQINRAMRLYARRGPLVLDHARSITEALDFLAGLKELHQLYWKGRGEPGAFAAPFFEAFHRRLITEALPAGHVELARVSAGGAPIGYLYNFLYRGAVLSYQSGFAYEKDPKLKPGLVSHALCIEAHAEAGRAHYDFMAGYTQQKASLGRPGPDMLYVLVQKPSAVMTAASLLRRYGKAMLRRSST